MELKSKTTAFDGTATVEVTISVDTGSALEAAVIEKFNKSLDELNGEVI